MTSSEIIDLRDKIKYKIGEVLYCIDPTDLDLYRLEISAIYFERNKITYYDDDNNSEVDQSELVFNDAQEAVGKLVELGNERKLKRMKEKKNES